MCRGAALYTRISAPGRSAARRPERDRRRRERARPLTRAIRLPHVTADPPGVTTPRRRGQQRIATTTIGCRGAHHRSTTPGSRRTEMRRVKHRAAAGRLRRKLVLIAVALVALAASAAAFAATKWPTSGPGDRRRRAWTRTSSSAAPSRSRWRSRTGCGLNAWSQESYAAVKSTAAQCKNVKVITTEGGDILSQEIADINSAVAQGAQAMTVIPDFGQAAAAGDPGGDEGRRQGRPVGR